MSKVRVHPSEKVEVQSSHPHMLSDNSKSNEDSPLNPDPFSRKKEFMEPDTIGPMNEESKLEQNDVMGANEQELEALFYDDKGTYSDDDSLEDELEDVVDDQLEDNKIPEQSDNLRQSYSNSFVRKVSDLKNKRIKKNKLKKMDTVVRDADNGLSYTRMMKRVELSHPRMMVDRKQVPYPICGTSTGWHLPSK